MAQPRARPIPPLTAAWAEARQLLREPLVAAAVLAVAAALVIAVFFPLARVVLLPHLEDWATFSERPRFLTVTANTLLMVALSTVTATATGFWFAYATTRVSRLPLAGLYRLVGLLPLVSPPFVTGLAFILLFGRRGLITHNLLGLEFDLYGWHGLWLAQTLSFFPVAYLLLAGVLRSINPALEQAARDLGARGFTLFRTVTLPLTLPGLAGAALLVANFVLADFGNPMLIGGDFSVLATEAYLQIVGRYDTRMAAVLVTVLFVPSVAFFLLQRWVLSRRSYVTVTGRPSSLERPPVSRAVAWLLSAGCLAVSLVVVAIYAVVVLGAFSRLWGVDWSLTLQNFEYTLFRGRELWNSVRFAAAAAVLTAAFSVVAAYLLYRKVFPGRASLEFLTLLPSALPGTLLGIGYVLAFNEPPLVLAGTGFIIVLVMAVRNLPVGYRAGVAALQQIDRSIEDASADLGAGSARTFWHVVLPLLKYAFTTTLVYTFVKSVNTLSAVIFVVSPGNNVASASILGLAEHGYWGQASALSAGLMAVTFVALGAFRLAVGGRARLFEI